LYVGCYWGAFPRLPHANTILACHLTVRTIGICLLHQGKPIAGSRPICGRIWGRKESRLGSDRLQTSCDLPTTHFHGGYHDFSCCSWYLSHCALHWCQTCKLMSVSACVTQISFINNFLNRHWHSITNLERCLPDLKRPTPAHTRSMVYPEKKVSNSGSNITSSHLHVDECLHNFYISRP